MRKIDFLKIYNGVLRCYSEKHQELFPTGEKLSQQIFSETTNIDLKILEKFSIDCEDYIKSILKRIIGVSLIIKARENNEKLNIQETWAYISSSIKLVPSEFNISSIGSQGFLSIPLYKFDEQLDKFDFIRLHIWDESIDKHIDLKKCKDFSIHSHTFFGESWIITGAINNETYEHRETEKSRYSLFKVEYNKSLNKVNQHSSQAVNQKINYDIRILSKETHYSGSHYTIKPGHLHKSGNKNDQGCSATFFSFTGKNGLDKSIVLGPSNIGKSSINRNEYIDPTHLLNKIENQIKDE